MRYMVGEWYRAGARGVVVTWRDGSTTTYAGRELFRFKETPAKIRGRLAPVLAHAALAYEAPRMVAT